MSTILVFALFTALVVVSAIGVASSGIAASGVSTISAMGRSYTGDVIQEGDADSRVAIVPIGGVIMSGDSGADGGSTGAEDAVALMQAIIDDGDFDAVILEVNSPGGGVLASAEIADKVAEMQRADIKVVSWMRETAASGGYYVSAGADRIVASPETITGSIGVIVRLYDATGLARKVGVQEINITSGELKSMGSAFSKLSPKARGVFQALVDESYTGFVQRVADGRNIPEARVREIADGRIYTGVQALELGLVDKLGTRTAAYEEAAKLIDAKKGSDLEVVRFAPELGFFGLLFQSVGDLVPTTLADMVRGPLGAPGAADAVSRVAQADSRGFSLEYRMVVR